MDGTGRSSLRNRRFLRAITPFTKIFDELPDDVSAVPESLTSLPESGLNEEINEIPREESIGETTSIPSRSSRVRRVPDRLGVNTFALNELTGGRA